MGQKNRQKVAKIAKLAKSCQNGKKRQNLHSAPCSKAGRSVVTSEIIIYINMFVLYYCTMKKVKTKNMQALLKSFL